MADKKGLKDWLWARRNVTRLAYALQMGARIASSFLSLVWIRLINQAMGTDLYGSYLTFQNIISLGGLGDLGMGGSVGIRAGQYLGQGKIPELQKFLASARAVFLIFALVAAGAVIVLTPWLPGWFNIKVDGVGSLWLLFGVGAVMVGCVLLSSYVSNLNYACGNVVWPIIPTFLLLQMTLCSHWLLARSHFPLWVQYLPYVAAAVIGLWLMHLYVRASHPAIAGIWPLKWDRGMAVTLFESSIWVYFCSLGNAIYRSTDGLVISSGFGPHIRPYYDSNYRICDLVVFVALTASLVSLPKITQWMASTEPKDQERVRYEMRRLNQFQTMIGCVAALGYLAGNDLIMKVWWYHAKDPIAPAALPLQLAFALNMAITASGDAGIQLSLRSGKHGLRVGGILIVLTGLLNLVLSIVAMKRGSLWGIAMATVAAQSILSLASSFYTCRYLQIPWLSWAVKSWSVPFGGIIFAAWLRSKLPFDSTGNIVLLSAVYLVMALAAAWILGVTPSFLREELATVKSFFKR